MKITVASAGSGGFDDTVSPVFRASPSFTRGRRRGPGDPGVETVANPTECVLGGGGTARTRPRRLPVT